MVEQHLVVTVESRLGHDRGRILVAAQGVLRTINSRIDGRLRPEDVFALNRVFEEACFSGARPMALQCCNSCLKVRMGKE